MSIEHTRAGGASSATRTAAEAKIALDWARGQGHFAMLHLTPRGVVR